MADTRLSRRAALGSGLAAAVSPLFGATSGAAEEKPLKIGVLVDTSGPASIHGERQLLGVRYQAELIGRGVQLDVRDTKGDVGTTRAEAVALLRDGVDGLIGTSMPATAAVVAEEAQTAGVPLVVPTTVLPPLPPFAFSSAATPLQARRQCMRAVRGASARRTALLIADTLATDQALKVYAEQAAAEGVELVTVTKFTTSATTLTEPVTTLLEQKPEAVIVAAPPPFNGLAARTLRELKWPGVICCGPAAGHPGFLQAAGEAAEGVRVPAPWLLLADRIPDTVPNSWVVRAFVASFVPKHGPVGTFLGYGVDAVGMLYHAYAGHRDRQRARATLEHMTYVGVSGVFRMSPDNHSGLDDAALMTFRARNGQWVADGA
ncbi:amino acid/amide ABC transporter substrate-binding protein (HAAT family) [Lentzea atacamensis]|uniref:Amino acid/amide ABC transporter substrate-binding protein (HAAT family) n=1 Tax=Lentzea atacamensis TaxID=531938 RepID=A0A316I1S7_9PSEU|nr:ABC transporter substrate-binding protein [Lentzea atacamensis]PWK86963.1 amino acid/amide ABC transporter substrate-binding protein (HAAT family) [Lentzea atacamensis]